MEDKLKILLVEDDENLGFVIKDNLEDNGYLVKLDTDGKSAWESFRREDFHLCIFDVMLPLKDGFTLAEEVRRQNQDVPIVFLTAKAMKEDRIKGFRIGGDDYITKPFSIEELLLRLEVIVKRSQKSNAKSTNGDVYMIGKYQFDFKNLILSIDNQRKDLTIKEAELLKLLYINKNQVLERDSILNIIWKNDDYFTGRSLDVFISRLRKYLKQDKNIEIANIHSVGFRMVVVEE
jgi:DNA-binding response OmpR family regulator